MTPEEIKELVLKNKELGLSEFIELLQSIDNTNDGITVEEYDCAIELNFSGINTFIHAFVVDEICEDEELYEEVVELAQDGDWEELEEKIIRFYVCVMDEDGNNLTTHEDFFLTREEWIRLGGR